MYCAHRHDNPVKNNSEYQLEYDALTENVPE